MFLLIVLIIIVVLIYGAVAGVKKLASEFKSLFNNKGKELSVEIVVDNKTMYFWVDGEIPVIFENHREDRMCFKQRLSLTNIENLIEQLKQEKKRMLK